MYRFPCALLALFIWAHFTHSAWSQTSGLEDIPKPYVAKKPPTRQEIEQRQSLHKYVYGLLCEQQDRFADALQAFEEAERLDPEAPAVIKAQVPILIALDRIDDALKACRKVLRLDPGDYLAWYIESKIHKNQARYVEAIASLEKGLGCPALQEHPEASQQMYFDLGSVCESAGKFGPAADAYQKAAAILEHPDRIMKMGPFPREAIQARAAETYEKIGQLYRKAKQFDKAAAALVKAQEQAPDRAARISFHLAELNLEQGDTAQALRHVDAYLATQPLGLEAYEMKIDLLTRLKEPAKILPWLDEAAQRDRFNNGLQLLLAREYTRARQSTKAEQIYCKLAEESPGPEVYRGLFQLYKQDGAAGVSRILTMLDKAMAKVANEDGPAPPSVVARTKAMTGALRDDGELAKALVHAAFAHMNKNDDLKYETVYFLAYLADRHRKTDEAELFYKKCLPGAKDNNEAVIYSGLMRVLSKQRKYDAIIKLCEVGLEKARATNPLLFRKELAFAHAGLHHYDEALRCTDRAILEAGDDKKLIFKIWRVRILSMAERFTDAETECLSLIKANSRPGEILELRYLLSNVYSAAKKQGKAEEQLQLILKIDPSNATVNNDLGYLWAEQNKKLDAAEALIRKALDQDRAQRHESPGFNADEDKDNAAFVDSLGWVLFRRGRIDEARKELERAITLGEGDDPVIYDHLGDVYNRLEMRREASRAWRRALELYDQGVRRKEDDRVRDIQRKIEQVKDEIGGR
jgi:tetratricopeptide (TPR) repeat protein